MTTLHDVLRWMIRGGRPNTEENQRLALLAIDAHENGYPDAESWQKVLDERAAAAREQADAPPGESAEERAARAEARALQLEAQLAAAAAPQAAPAPTTTPAPES